jgi:lycopene beta-cyclase
MSEKTFDYAIIGAGAAGLQLALAFTEDPFFASKSILLLDADQKEFNDKTWCFWENGEGPWESLITKTWGKTVFADQKGTLHLESAPYTYKMLRSIDFYAFAKSKIASSKNINWLHDRVVGTKELPDGLQISTKSGNHKVSHCFDSRIPEQFIKGGDSYHRVQQHFKGQVLRFEKPVFDPESFLMMDYRLVFENKTSFMYILPLNAKEALLEYTFFSPNLEQDIVYKEQIKAYIKKYIKEET